MLNPRCILFQDNQKETIKLKNAIKHENKEINRGGAVAERLVSFSLAKGSEFDPSLGHQC